MILKSHLELLLILFLRLKALIPLLYQRLPAPHQWILADNIRIFVLRYLVLEPILILHFPFLHEFFVLSSHHFLHIRRNISFNQVLVFFMLELDGSIWENCKRRFIFQVMSGVLGGFEVGGLSGECWWNALRGAGRRARCLSSIFRDLKGFTTIPKLNLRLWKRHLRLNILKPNLPFSFILYGALLHPRHLI